MKAPDHIVNDLMRKCGDDVGQRIKMSTQFFPDAGDRLAVALSACGVAIGMAAGFGQVRIDQVGEPPMPPEEAVDTMLALLRPIALMALGGSDADFRALLEKCRG